MAALSWLALGAGGEGNSCHDAAREGRYEQAVSACSRLVQTSRDSHALAMAYNSRARAHNHLGKYKKAVEDATKAIELLPQFGLAHRNRGNAYLGLGRCGRAARDYQVSVELMPGSADGYNNLAWVLSTCPKGEFRDGPRAIKLMTKALALENSSGLWDTMAAAQAEAGDFAAAVESQTKALQMQKEKDSHVIDGMQQRLASYLAGKPWRFTVVDWTP